jgi:hypothetical protein
MSTLSGRPSSPALAPFVGFLNCHEGEIPDAVERVLPTGRIHVLVNLYEDEFRTHSGPDCATRPSDTRLHATTRPRGH